jgi:hypothetical protein
VRFQRPVGTADRDPPPNLSASALDVNAATAYQLAISEEPQMSDVNKPARDYLKASGATAISVVAIDGVCSFHAGHKIDPGAVSIHWLREEQAAALVKQARHDAGRAPDAGTAAAALRGAACDQRITLTSHAVAVERAGVLGGIGEAAPRPDPAADVRRATFGWSLVV